MEASWHGGGHQACCVTHFRWLHCRRRQYEEWSAGLSLLLVLLLQPDEALRRPSAAGGLARFASGMSAAGSSGAGRHSVSLAQEAILPGSTASDLAGLETWHVSAAAGAAAAAAGGSGIPPSDGSFLRKLAISTGRVCARNDSQSQLAAASARSSAALAAATAALQQAAAAGEGGGKQQQAAGQQAVGQQAAGQQEQQQQQAQQRRRIQLVASSASLHRPSALCDLHAAIKLSSSEGTLELPPSRSQPASQQSSRRQPGSAALQRQQLLLRRRWQAPPRAVEKIKSGLRRAVTLPAHLWRTGSGAAGLAARQGNANGSPSRQPLKETLNPSSSSCDLAGVGAAQQAQQQGEAGLVRHERALTLGEWAEQPAHQQPPVPPLNLQHLAAGGSSARDAAAVAAQRRDSGPEAGVPAPPPPQRTTPPSTGRMLLPGPFIHLQGKSTAWSSMPPLLPPACARHRGSAQHAAATARDLSRCFR